MSYRFVVGESGCGKTTYAMKYMLERAQDSSDTTFLYIVPEQFTMQSQKALVDLHPGHCVMDIDILSFNRLSFRIFRELGIDSLNVLEDNGKNLIIRKLAGECRNELSVLANHIGNMAYIDEIKSFISELMQYRVEPPILRSIIEKEGLSPLLKSKLSDILLIYEKFLSYIEGEYVTAELLLSLLSENITKSKKLSDAVIVFDGFTGFTPVQNDVVERLLPYCKEIIFTVTMDPAEAKFVSIREEELFYMSKNYISSVRNMAARAHVSEDDMVVIEGKRLCKDTFVFEADNPRQEINLVAEKIVERVKNGARYRDMAVVSGNQDIYIPYMEEVFSEYKIPFFCDKAALLSFHPLIGFIKNLFDIITKNFSSKNVISLVKHELSGFDTDESDLFENYIHATGIRGYSAYTKDFFLTPQGVGKENLVHINSVRKRLIEMLSDTYLKYKSKTKKYDISDMNRDIYNLLDRFDLERLLFEKEQEQVFYQVMDCMLKAGTFLGNEELLFSEYCDVLFAGISLGKLGTLPKSADMVVFGDTVRTRLDDIDTLFIVGANEGVLPPVSTGGGMVSARDRQVLLENDIVLAPNDRQRQFAGSFYMYLTITRPQKELFVSYSVLDGAGSAIRPSYIVENICRERGCEVKKYESYDRFSGIVPQIDTNDTLNSRILRAIDKGEISASVSRLESYSRCSYAYFLNYILSLKEKAVYGMDARDMGNIYHDSLYNFFTFLKEEKCDVNDLSEGKRRDLIGRSLEFALKPIEKTGDYDNPYENYTKSKVREVLEKNLDILIHQIQKSSFRPTYFETNLKDICDKDELCMKLDDDSQMYLNGKIDRIDLSNNEDSLYIKVIDYKSGENKFDYTKLFGGIQIQLLFYLDAAKKSMIRKNPDKKIMPSAMLYYHIDDTVKEVDIGVGEEKIRDVILSEMRPHGLILNDADTVNALDNEIYTKNVSDVIRARLKKDGDFYSDSQVISKEDLDYLMDFVRRKVRSVAGDIAKGKITKNPFRTDKGTACDFCQYHGICGFDAQTDGYRDIHKINSLEEFKAKDGV